MHRSLVEMPHTALHLCCLLLVKLAYGLFTITTNANATSFSIPQSQSLTELYVPVHQNQAACNMYMLAFFPSHACGSNMVSHCSD